MDLEIVHPAEFGDVEHAQWRAALQQAGFRSPFLSPTFSTLVARHRPGSRVALLRSGGTVTGFLPYERDDERVGTSIGHGINDVQAIIGSAPYGCELPEIVRRLGVREWRYDHLLDSQVLFAPYRERTHRSPTIDLLRGHDDWIETLNGRSSVVSKPARLARQLAKDIGPVTVEWHSDREQDLSRLVALKAAQYQRTGAADVFREPWVVGALREFWRS